MSYPTLPQLFPAWVEGESIIEAGWRVWHDTWIERGLPVDALQLAHGCFFAGALHAATMVLLGEPMVANAVIDELKRWSDETDKGEDKVSWQSQ